MRKRFMGLVIAAVAFLITSAVPSSAASLNVGSAELMTYSQDRCVDAAEAAPATANPSTTVSLAISGLEGECLGAHVDITLYGASGLVLSRTTAVLPASATTAATLTVPSYDPAAVRGAAMTIATWGVPTTWAYTPPATSCDVYDKNTNRLMPGAGCSLGTPTYEWDWGPRLRVYIPVAVTLPAGTSTDAYYEIAFMPDSGPPEWSWDKAGFPVWGSGQANQCAAAIESSADGVRITTRTGSNIGFDWAVYLSLDQVSQRSFDYCS